MTATPGQAVNFDDKIVITPVELYRDKALNGQCFALFGVMKSFGPRAEAKVSTYGSRLGWTQATVEKYQKILRKAGWIVLLREGSEHNPRLWWMCRVKNEAPPQDIETGGIKNRPPKKQAPGKSSPLKNRPPKISPPKQKKVLQAVELDDKQKKGGKEIAPPPPTATPRDQNLTRLDQAYKSRWGRVLTRTDDNIELANRAAVIFGAELEVSWAAYLKSSGNKGGLESARHPIAWFVSQPDTWLPIPKPQGPPVRPPVDPEILKREAAAQKATQEADAQHTQAFLGAWSLATAGARQHLLDLVRSQGDFMDDLVRRSGAQITESLTLTVALRDLWTEKPQELTHA